MCWFPLDAMAVKCLNSSAVPGGPNGKAIDLRCRGVLTQQHGALSIDYFSCIGVLVTYRIRHQLCGYKRRFPVPIIDGGPRRF